MSLLTNEQLDERLKFIGSKGQLVLAARELGADDKIEDLHDQLDAEFAEREPGSTPITIRPDPPECSVDEATLDRYLAELVRVKR